tara:strand:- start:1048 stop:1293 length:246 start_codon:yes stop_codon:yes gene_type:complete
MTENEIISEAIEIGSVCEVDEWMDLKKLLLRALPPSARSNFSVRDPKTKKQNLNEFELRLIDNYYSKTGKKLRKGVKSARA